MEIEKQILTEEKETNMGQQLMAKYLPYWPLLVLFVMMAFAGAYFYLRYATPIYEASATIIIKDEKRGAGSEDSRILESLDLIASKKTIENEIEVLQSRALMEKVVKALRLYASYTIEGKVKAGDAYLLSPIMIEAQNADSIIGVEKVPFSYDKNSQTVTINGNEKFPINQYVSTPYGKLKFSPNKHHFSAINTGDKKFFFSLDEAQNV
ncbi:MAG TPA: Wzz/FepE/Etk N-terminal domain-containing protein, partial [Ferruginibacter sp.]|nr:Wzz/FepE/Etk N-terminal domain-containing protein [Ferruginibacter sp.]